MDFNKWLEKVQSTYIIELKDQKGDNHFVTRTVFFNDPNKEGLSFEITLDETNNPTSFTANPFSFAWFNVAEGATPPDILTAAESCLSGKLNIRKNFLTRKYRLEFTLASYRGRSQAVGVSHKEVSGFLGGYKAALN